MAFNSPPTMQVPHISELEDKVLGLLEEAGIPTAINDRIMALIQAGERPSEAPPKLSLEAYLFQLERAGRRISDVEQPYGASVARHLRQTEPQLTDYAHIVAHLLADLDRARWVST